MRTDEAMRNGTLSGNAIEARLRQPRIWLDFGKLVVAAVVQGVVVSAVVALVVMLLASGAVAEPADAAQDGRPVAASQPATGVQPVQ